MRDNRKSTDPGLSAAERKAQRSREAQEAIADLEKAQRAFHEKRERLQVEPEFLADDTGEKTPHRMLLPSCCGNERRDRSSRRRS